MPTNDHLTVRFEYSPAGHADAVADWPDRRTWLRWWKPLDLGFLAILLAWAASRGMFSDWIGALLLLPLFLMAAPLVFLPEFARKRLRAHFLREAAQRDDPFETRTFGPDGFSPGAQ